MEIDSKNLFRGGKDDSQKPGKFNMGNGISARASTEEFAGLMHTIDRLGKRVVTELFRWHRQAEASKSKPEFIAPEPIEPGHAVQQKHDRELASRPKISASRFYRNELLRNAKRDSKLHESDDIEGETTRSSSHKSAKRWSREQRAGEVKGLYGDRKFAEITPMHDLLQELAATRNSVRAPNKTETRKTDQALKKALATVDGQISALRRLAPQTNTLLTAIKGMQSARLEIERAGGLVYVAPSKPKAAKPTTQMNAVVVPALWQATVDQLEALIPSSSKPIRKPKSVRQAIYNAKMARAGSTDTNPQPQEASGHNGLELDKEFGERAIVSLGWRRLHANGLGTNGRGRGKQPVPRALHLALPHAPLNYARPESRKPSPQPAG